MMNPENTDNLEININTPSSPLVPLHIHNFVKDINIPIEMKIQTNDSLNMTGGSATATTDNGIFGYFKSFFQGFSQQTLQKKKHDTQNKSYLNSLFYSGNEEKSKVDNPEKENEEKSKVDNPEKENEEKPKVDNPEKENEEKPKVDNPEKENEDEDEEKVDNPPEKENEDEEKDVVITKIILTTEDPEMILRESMKGTKLYYLSERKDLPSQWV